MTGAAEWNDAEHLPADLHLSAPWAGFAGVSSFVAKTIRMSVFFINPVGQSKDPAIGEVPRERINSVYCPIAR